MSSIPGNRRKTFHLPRQLWTRKHVLRTYQVLIAGFPGPCVNWWPNPCAFLEAICPLGHFHCELWYASSAFSALPPSCFPVKLYSHSTLTQTNAKFTVYSFATFGREMEGGGRKKRTRRRKRSIIEGRKQKKAHNPLSFILLICYMRVWSKVNSFFLNAKTYEENYGSFLFFFKGHVHTQYTTPPLWGVHGF